jgi:hypothetical protein
MDTIILPKEIKQWLENVVQYLVILEDKALQYDQIITANNAQDLLEQWDKIKNDIHTRAADYDPDYD